MGVSLFVERPGRANAISLEEWWKLVADEPDLRLRAEPYSAINPKTGIRFFFPLGCRLRDAQRNAMASVSPLCSRQVGHGVSARICESGQ